MVWNTVNSRRSKDKITYLIVRSVPASSGLALASSGLALAHAVADMHVGGADIGLITNDVSC